MLDCDPNAMAQNVRMVCMGGVDQAKCDHVMDQGAEGKLVRLPENCGKGPFAVVGKSYVHPDQSLPASMKVKLQRRGVAAPTVRGMSIHMDWHTVEPKAGPVNIELLGFNAPGFNGDTSSSLGNKVVQRGFLDTLKNIGKKIVGGVETVGKDIASVATAVATEVKQAATAVATEVKQVATTVGNGKLTYPKYYFRTNCFV